MKELKCYDCEEVFEADTSEDMLNHLYTHYTKEHKETITGNTEEEKKAWMEKFNKDWDETKEI